MNLSLAQEFLLLEQNNYFFDTPDFILRSNSLTVRLRHENSHFTLCMKGNDPRVTKSKKNISIRLEYENIIPENIALQLLEQKIAPLDYIFAQPISDNAKKTRTREFLCSQISILTLNKPLQMIGSFTNQRTCIPIFIGAEEFLIEMDKTKFLSEFIHYELELEIPANHHYQKSEEFLLELFKKASAEFFPSNGKTVRFYQFLASQG
jgi:uncharacterized protein YjbK